MADAATVDRLEHLVELLNPRTGSPLSINSLREDLGVAFETVRGWLTALERVYYLFGVATGTEIVVNSRRAITSATRKPSAASPRKTSAPSPPRIPMSS